MILGNTQCPFIKQEPQNLDPSLAEIDKRAARLETFIKKLLKPCLKFSIAIADAPQPLQPSFAVRSLDPQVATWSRPRHVRKRPLDWA